MDLDSVEQRLQDLACPVCKNSSGFVIPAASRQAAPWTFGCSLPSGTPSTLSRAHPAGRPFWRSQRWNSSL